MRHSISSMQSNPVIAHNEAGSGNIQTSPIRSVFNSTQSFHVVRAKGQYSANWRASDSTLQTAFSGVRGCKVLDAQVRASSCSAAQVITHVQQPAVIADKTPSVQQFIPIQEAHFHDWIAYNAKLHHLRAQGLSTPPEIDVNSLLAMINGDHACQEPTDQPRIQNRAEQFAQKHKINPLAWSVIVIFNGKPATFLPRRDHCVMAQTNRPGYYNPITVFDVKKWLHHVKNHSGRISQISFAKKHKLNPSTFRKTVDSKGKLMFVKECHWNLRKTVAQIFIAPELLGISHCFNERISADHIMLWKAARQINDYGIMCYLSRQQPGLLSLEATVRCWRLRQEMSEQTSAVLTVSDFASEYNVAAGLWQEVVTDIGNWDRISALYRLHFAMAQFASHYYLDPFVWHFFAWSNELATLTPSVSAIEQTEKIQQIQQIQHMLFNLQERLKERLKSIADEEQA